MLSERGGVRVYYVEVLGRLKFLPVTVLKT